MNFFGWLVLTCWLAFGSGQSEQPLQEEALVEVRIESRDHKAHRGQPVAHVPFRVLRWGQAPLSEPYMRGVTDEAGVATIRLPEDWLSEVHPRVHILVNQPGCMRTQGHWLKLGRTWSHGKPVCRLVVQPGTTRFLQSVDAHGEKIGARIGWCFVSDRGRELRHRPKIQERGGPGWLAIHLEEPQTVDVWAYSPGVGSALLRDVPWGQDPNQPIVLTLRGEGNLEGHVRDAMGRGEAKLNLFFRLVNSDIKPPRIFGMNYSSPGRGYGSRGLRWGTVTTAADGGFALQGMQPGSYEVWFRRISRNSEPWERLHDQIVSTESGSLVIRPPTPRLQVRLLEADGTPWTSGFGPKLPGWKGHARAAGLHLWPTKPVLIVHEVDSLDPQFLAWWLAQATRHREPNVGLCDVPPGKTYVLQVVGGSFLGEPQWISVGDDLGVRQATVRAAPSAPFGSLTVQARAGSHQLEADYPEPDFELYLADLESGLPLIDRAPWEKGDKTFTVPPGQYRVVLQGRASIDSHHGTLISRRSYGRVERVVSIASGQVQEEEWTMEPGGFLSVSVEGHGNAKDWEALLANHPSVSREDPEWVEWSQRVRLRLHKPQFPSEPVYFAAVWGEGTSAHGTHLYEEWPFGKEAKSEMLPTGTFTLWASTWGGRTVTQEVTIRQGETTPVRIVIPDED